MDGWSNCRYFCSQSRVFRQTLCRNGFAGVAARVLISALLLGGIIGLWLLGCSVFRKSYRFFLAHTL
ncbi:hypothetical protein B4168_3102 [Anoxybacillus flavithermus]|nr:hypothetical protein B4168_3102 [Anoxybacillus flavithermus]